MELNIVTRIEVLEESPMATKLKNSEGTFGPEPAGRVEFQLGRISEFRYALITINP